MSNDLKRRLEALQARIREAYGSSPDGFLAVLVFGGLTPLPAVASDDKGGEWIRDVAAGESVEDFAQRAARESHGHGARLCTIGGMGRSTPSQTKALREAWDQYMLTEYSDVPPCEEGPRWAAPRSRLGHSVD
jgi:hypothetical protein